jgi:hypothetical protein
VLAEPTVPLCSWHLAAFCALSTTAAAAAAEGVTLAILLRPPSRRLSAPAAESS